MIRYSILWLVVFSLMGYAWKDWCKSICILIIMLAVLERPDMPKTIFGIQGLNPFNLALFGILIPWAVDQFRIGRWDVPRWFTILLGTYVTMIVIAFGRLIVDPGFLVDPRWAQYGVRVYTADSLMAEFLINSVKWLIPAVMLVVGCRTREQQRWAVLCVSAVYVLLALQVIKQMPVGLLLDGEALQQRAANILQRRVGYHRVDLAAMFAGGAWAILAARPLFTEWWIRTGLLGASAITTFGLAMTGGRTGYATWCIVGLLMAFLKWRRYLLLLPAALLLAVTLMPGVSERMLQGFDTVSVDATYDGAPLVEGEVDEFHVTSGRNEVWPLVLQQIRQHPYIGLGRQTFSRTDLRTDVSFHMNEIWGHPHSAYLEFLLDNGSIGLSLVLLFFFAILLKGVRMFLDRTDPAITATGGMATAMMVALLIAAGGAQTFYPTEGSVGMWCMIALAIRVAAGSKDPMAASPSVSAVVAVAPNRFGRPSVAARAPRPAPFRGALQREQGSSRSEDYPEQPAKSPRSLQSPQSRRLQWPRTGSSRGFR
jgi:O-antigen ligase